MAESRPFVFIKMTPEADQPPAVSVIIPTYNRAASLRRVLMALADQLVTAQRYEVLVISDGSTDTTAQLCAELDVPYALRFFEQQNQGPAAARNRGVQEARGTVLLFLDDDVVPERNLISEHMRLHKRDPRAVVIGPLLLPSDARLQPWIRWEAKMLVKQYDDMEEGRWAVSPRQFYTGNASVARAAVIEIGGFDPSFTRAEDVELAYRLADIGMRFYFEPEARGWHYARRSFSSWLRIPDAYGRNDARMYTEQDRGWILEAVGWEFHQRHRLIRALGHLCVGRRWACALVVQACRVIAALATVIPTEAGYTIAGYAYSVIFNIRYWNGIAAALGPRAFWAFVRQFTPSAKNERPEESLIPSR